MTAAIAIAAAWLMTSVTSRLDRFGPVAWPFRVIDELVWHKDWYIAKSPRFYFLVLAEYWGGNILFWSAFLFAILRWVSRLANARRGQVRGA